MLSSGHTPTLTQCKEQASPPSGSEQAREPVTCSGSPCVAGTPSKALAEFLVWPLANSYWLGKAKNPGQ